MKAFDTIDECISTFPKDVQVKLEKIRKIIKTTAPSATETISYGIPTFKINGRNLIHFNGYKNHIAIYPGSHAVEVFKKDLKDYKTSKGTIQFPIEKELPYDLIKKIIEFRLKEETKN